MIRRRCAHCNRAEPDLSQATASNGKVFSYCWRAECRRAVLAMVKAEGQEHRDRSDSGA